MTVRTLLERREALEKERTQLSEFLTSKRKKLADGSETYDLTATEIGEVRARNAELDRVTVEWEQAREIEDVGLRNTERLAELRTAERLPHGGAAAREDAAPAGARGSLGQRFVESEAFTRRNSKGSIAPVMLDMDPEGREFRTLFQTSAGWDPEDTRTGRLVLDEQQPAPVVADIIPRTRTKQSTVLWMEETTFTNNAAEAAEGTALGEAALVVTEKNSEVRKVGVWIPVTEEQLEDEQRVRGYLNNRMGFMLRQRLDLQILVGSGVSPNLTGLLNVSGINTQAKGGDPTPDAIHKAIVKVRVNGFCEPTHVVAHPNDWQDVRLLRTADGIYLWGNPSEAGIDRIWGKPVIESTYETENTMLVGDFRGQTELAVRRGVEMEITDAHSDYFINLKLAIRATFRVAFICYRPKGFSTVTGV